MRKILFILVSLVFIVGCAKSTSTEEPRSLEQAIDQVRDEERRMRAGDGHIDREVLERRLDDDFEAKGADCRKFLNPDGTPGEYGDAILDAFEHHEHLSVLLENEAASAHSMPQLCPNFKKFTTTERAYFWVWTFAAIAWDESTCKPSARNPASPNSAAVGLLQLEDPLRLRHWRGPLCDVKSVRGPRANLHCGMEIMRGQFEGMYSGGRCGGHAGLSMPCSYWQKLRKNWSTVHRLIMLYPGCRKR